MEEVQQTTQENVNNVEESYKILQQLAMKYKAEVD